LSTIQEVEAKIRALGLESSGIQIRLEVQTPTENGLPRTQVWSKHTDANKSYQDTRILQNAFNNDPTVMVGRLICGVVVFTPDIR
jgi:hypothetical protein